MAEDRETSGSVIRTATSGVTFAAATPEPTGEPAIVIRNGNLWYGQNQALHDITMNIPAKP